MNEYSWDRTGVGSDGRQGRGYQSFDRDGQWGADRSTHSYGRGGRDEGDRSSGSSLRDSGYGHMSPGSNRSGDQLGRSRDDGRYQSAPAQGGNREWRGDYGDGEEFGGGQGGQGGQYGGGQYGNGQGGPARYDSRGEDSSSRSSGNSGRFEDRMREPSGRGYGQGRQDMGTSGWSQQGQGQQGQGSYGGSSMGSGGSGASYGGRYENSRSDSMRSSVGGGKDHSGRGPKAYRRSDDRIEEEVNERLKGDRDLDASDIEVSVESGVVTLSGNVSDRRSKRMAEECCDDISGVDDVTNQIRVKAQDDESTTPKSASSSSSSSKSGSQQSPSRNTSASGQTVSPSRS